MLVGCGVRDVLYEGGEGGCKVHSERSLKGSVGRA